MLYLLPHLGLGDAVVCNGMVRELSTRYDRVAVPVKWHNRASVKWMWGDLDNVVLLGVVDDREAVLWAERFEHGKSPVLRLGLHSGRLETQWDRQMYHQTRVDFRLRWDKFKAPPVASDTDTGTYSFLHDDPARGFVIDRNRVPNETVAVGQQPTIFHVLPWLQTAPEVHVIDSVFLCLADSVPTTGKLVFHRYARPGGKPPTLRKKWEVM